jgi:hypothetical protein
VELARYRTSQVTLANVEHKATPGYTSVLPFPSPEPRLIVHVTDEHKWYLILLCTRRLPATASISILTDQLLGCKCMRRSDCMLGYSSLRVFAWEFWLGHGAKGIDKRSFFFSWLASWWDNGIGVTFELLHHCIHHKH